MQPTDKLLFDKAVNEHGNQAALATYLDIDQSLISYWKNNGFTKAWRHYFVERYGDPEALDSTHTDKPEK